MNQTAQRLEAMSRAREIIATGTALAPEESKFLKAILQGHCLPTAHGAVWLDGIYRRTVTVNDPRG